MRRCREPGAGTFLPFLCDDVTDRTAAKAYAGVIDGWRIKAAIVDQGREPHVQDQ
jgi:hypothetical protein